MSIRDNVSSSIRGYNGSLSGLYLYFSNDGTEIFFAKITYRGIFTDPEEELEMFYSYGVVNERLNAFQSFVYVFYKIIVTLSFGCYLKRDPKTH